MVKIIKVSKGDHIWKANYKNQDGKSKGVSLFASIIMIRYYGASNEVS